MHDKAEEAMITFLHDSYRLFENKAACYTLLHDLYSRLAFAVTINVFSVTEMNAFITEFGLPTEKALREDLSLEQTKKLRVTIRRKGDECEQEITKRRFSKKS